MGELIAEVGVLPTSAGGLLILICLLIVTGGIPTRRELRDTQAQRDKAMELAEKWQQVATEHGMTFSKILDAVETTNHIVTAIQAGLANASDKGPE